MDIRKLGSALSLVAVLGLAVPANAENIRMDVGQTFNGLPVHTHVAKYLRDQGFVPPVLSESALAAGGSAFVIALPDANSANGVVLLPMHDNTMAELMVTSTIISSAVIEEKTVVNSAVIEGTPVTTTTTSTAVVKSGLPLSVIVNAPQYQVKRVKNRHLLSGIFGGDHYDDYWF